MLRWQVGDADVAAVAMETAGTERQALVAGAWSVIGCSCIAAGLPAWTTTTRGFAQSNHWRLQDYGACPWTTDELIRVSVINSCLVSRRMCTCWSGIWLVGCYIWFARRGLSRVSPSIAPLLVYQMQQWPARSQWTNRLVISRCICQGSAVMIVDWAVVTRLSVFWHQKNLRLLGFDVSSLVFVSVF